MRQRLAAVLAADIVGYTRLMGADQAGTLRALQSFRSDILRPAIASQGGKIIKDMGDGWLVEFSSTSEAVEAALAVQGAMAVTAAFRLRIGINIGDILHEDEDIFGDGVNIAARLQSIAPVGGIALSGAAYDSLDGTLTPAFTDAGLHELRNVQRPVRVWMQHASADAPLSRQNAATSQTLTRVAISPIVGLGHAPELAELAESIGGDLLRLLNSSDWIWPNITSTHTGSDYTLSGVLRLRGDQIRLEARLTAELDEAIWSADFDGLLSNQFAWQDHVALDVAANVVGAVSDCERGRLFEQDADALSAQECLECAILEFFEISDDALASALDYVERAIACDPDFAPAYLWGVRCVLSALVSGYRNRVTTWLGRLPDWLERAEQAEGGQIKLGLYRAIWSYTKDRDTEQLQDNVAEALHRLPMDPDILCLGGWCHVWLGQPAQAIACFRKFEHLGKFNSLTMAMRGGLAIALVQAARYAAAAAEAQGILRQTREFSTPFRALASAAALMGDLPEARAAVGEALRLVPGDTLTELRARSGYLDTEVNARLFEGLRLAGYPED